MSLRSLETGSRVFEVQAQLTKDPNDKDYFHRKQQLTLCGGEEIDRAKRPRESLENGLTSSVVDLESVPKSPTIEPNWANIDVETCMAIMGRHTFLWGHHEMSNVTIEAFDKNAKPCPKLFLFVNRLRAQNQHIEVLQVNEMVGTHQCGGGRRKDL
jgi:hypothetical protein